MERERERGEIEKRGIEKEREGKTKREIGRKHGSDYKNKSLKKNTN
jgi:hypothetical protein